MGINAVSANNGYSEISDYYAKQFEELQNEWASEFAQVESTDNTITTQEMTATSAGSGNNGDILSLSNTSGCTDGEDDGKIGFFSALGNTIKGAVKGLGNMVVGAFTKTDENGERHFSLGKTLTTLAVTAVCVAFPAVGLAACAVGAVTGAVQVAKGVYNAANAETDAEAKSAFQNIGSGTLQVGLSVCGAKNSLSAVKSTSTAGGSGQSALEALGKDASITQKAGALAKDMGSSTLNQGKMVFGKMTTTYTSAKQTSTKFKDLTAELKKAKESGDEAAISQAKQNIAEFKNNNNLNLSSAIDKLKNDFNETNFNEAVKEIKNTKGTKIMTKAELLAKGVSKDVAEAYQAITSTENSYATIMNKFGYENVAQALELAAGVRISDENM